MTDARLRGEWINSFLFDNLSDIAWRTFTTALMFSAQNGTDGHLPQRYLKRLHPDGETPEAYKELVTAGIWSRVTDGYQMTDWKGALGQSTAEEVEAYKAKGRLRSQEYRKNQLAKQKKANSNAAGSAGEKGSEMPTTKNALPNVTGDVTQTTTGEVITEVTSDVTQTIGSDELTDVGKGKGKGSRDNEVDEKGRMKTMHPSDPEAREPDNSWPVASLGQAKHEPTCGVCGSQLLHRSSKESGICGKTDFPHNQARQVA